MAVDGHIKVATVRYGCGDDIRATSKTHIFPELVDQETIDQTDAPPSFPDIQGWNARIRPAWEKRRFALLTSMKLRLTSFVVKPAP